ncbi:MAG: site-2 protease family protein [Patescibacteria group bacterium]
MLILQLWQQNAHQPIVAIVSICGIVLGVMLALSVHEFAHAWMANRLGDDTAKYQGRLTLNPLAHIDPMGLFLFVFAGFGFGKPVPYNPNALKSDLDEIKIAIAGPISNLLVALIFALPARIMTIAGLPTDQSIFLLFLDAIVSLNIILAVFNIIPIPPLDGSKIVNYFLDHEAREVWERIGPALLLTLVFSNIIFGSSGGFNLLSRIMDPLLRIANLAIRGAPQIF